MNCSLGAGNGTGIFEAGEIAVVEASAILRLPHVDEMAAVGREGQRREVDAAGRIMGPQSEANRIGQTDYGARRRPRALALGLHEHITAAVRQGDAIANGSTE